MNVVVKKTILINTIITILNDSICGSNIQLKVVKKIKLEINAYSLIYFFIKLNKYFNHIMKVNATMINFDACRFFTISNEIQIQ